MPGYAVVQLVDQAGVTFPTVNTAEADNGRAKDGIDKGGYAELSCLSL